MNDVRGERTVDGCAEKRAKMRGHRMQGGGKEEDEWCQSGEQTADGFAEKRAKMRGVATQWAPEGNEWRIQTHQTYRASWVNTWHPDAKVIRQMHFFFLLIKGGSSVIFLEGKTSGNSEMKSGVSGFVMVESRVLFAFLQLSVILFSGKEMMAFP